MYSATSRSSDGVISANATAITASATKTTNATPSSLLRAFGAIERCVAFEPKSASVIRSRALRTVAIRFSDLAFFSDFFTASRPSLYSSSAASSAAASASASARSASAKRMIALAVWAASLIALTLTEAAAGDRRWRGWPKLARRSRSARLALAGERVRKDTRRPTDRDVRPRGAARLQALGARA